MKKNIFLLTIFALFVHTAAPLSVSGPHKKAALTIAAPTIAAASLALFFKDPEVQKSLKDGTFWQLMRNKAFIKKHRTHIAGVITAIGCGIAAVYTETSSPNAADLKIIRQALSDNHSLIHHTDLIKSIKTDDFKSNEYENILNAYRAAAIKYHTAQEDHDEEQMKQLVAESITLRETLNTYVTNYFKESIAFLERKTTLTNEEKTLLGRLTLAQKRDALALTDDARNAAARIIQRSLKPKIHFNVDKRMNLKSRFNTLLALKKERVDERQKYKEKEKEKWAARGKKKTSESNDEIMRKISLFLSEPQNNRTAYNFTTILFPDDDLFYDVIETFLREENINLTTITNDNLTTLYHTINNGLINTYCNEQKAPINEKLKHLFLKKEKDRETYSKEGDELVLIPELTTIFSSDKNTHKLYTALIKSYLHANNLAITEINTISQYIALYHTIQSANIEKFLTSHSSTPDQLKKILSAVSTTSFDDNALKRITIAGNQHTKMVEITALLTYDTGSAKLLNHPNKTELTTRDLNRIFFYDNLTSWIAFRKAVIEAYLNRENLSPSTINSKTQLDKLYNTVRSNYETLYTILNLSNNNEQEPLNIEMLKPFLRHITGTEFTDAYLEKKYSNCDDLFRKSAIIDETVAIINYDTHMKQHLNSSKKSIATIEAIFSDKSFPGSLKTKIYSPLITRYLEHASLTPEKITMTEMEILYDAIRDAHTRFFNALYRLKENISLETLNTIFSPLTGKTYSDESILPYLQEEETYDLFVQAL